MPIGVRSDTLTIPAVRWAGAGVYDVGATSECGSATSSPAPLVVVCPANTNQDGAVLIQDLFDYLSLFLVGDPRADVTGDLDSTLQDLFDYLGAFLQGCQ